MKIIGGIIGEHYIMTNLAMLSETAIMGGMLLTVFVTTFILVAKAIETDRINRRTKLRRNRR